MNTLSKLSFLAMALTLASCNEKVSPELQGANATSTTTGGPTIIPEEYYFRIVNDSDTMLNFKLHKTGTGNANSNCEVKSNLALSSESFRADPATFDISCFFEAEELVLSHNGLEFDIEASPNTCQYIGYSPFSYYNFQPGSSTQSVHKLNCDKATAVEANALDPSISATQPCATLLSETLGATPVQVESVQDYCQFDYSSNTSFEGAPNCDEGTIKLYTHTIAGTDSDGNGTIDQYSLTTSVTNQKCGGKAVNCIEGPIKLTTLGAKYTSGVEVTRATVDAAYTDKKTLPEIFGKFSNRRYVNFRRDLASTEIEYGNSSRNYQDGDSSNDTTLASAYMSSFGDPLYKNSYDPDVMSLYANNKRMDGTTLVTNTMVTNRKFDYLRGDYSAGTAFAAEPFVGLGSYKTNPYYTFYCYDNAFDLKARIRMVVRDWDRTLPASPTSASFERISDVDQLPPFARQDVPYTQEVTGDPDSWNDFNDIYDWDDFIDMERDDSGVPYDPSITVYRPVPVIPFTDGFLNPLIFPMEVPQ